MCGYVRERNTHRDTRSSTTDLSCAALNATSRSLTVSTPLAVVLPFIAIPLDAAPVFVVGDAPLVAIGGKVCRGVRGREGGFAPSTDMLLCGVV